MRWHFFADSGNSSQAFALSAFLPVLEFPDRDAILEELVTQHLPAVPRRPGRTWNLAPEFSRPLLLGETGRGEATTIDILLTADDAVVCVEAKLRVDARQGWGRCSQPPRLCEGFHGAGSDRKGTAAACRLERPDGNRGPRFYWHVARGHFREEALAEQQPPAVCPFLTTYQLMRNYLFAARFAEQEGLPHHGVLGLVPAGGAGALEAGTRAFKETVLLPAHAARVAVAQYETYLGLLAAGSHPARELAGFLAALLA